jgi:Zn-finger nucleic acid-binding protein
MKEILIDFCPKCKSLWLDKNELDRIRHRSGKSASEISAEARREKKYEAVLEIKGFCPRCSCELEIYYEGTVKLERCSSCEGMFFDRGELEECLKQEEISFIQKIIKLLKGEKNGT